MHFNQSQLMEALKPHQGHSSQARRGWAASICALILACIPPFILFSGPYEAMWTVHHFPAAKFTFWAIGLMTVFFTALYLFRGVFSLFQPVVAFGNRELPSR